MDPASRTQSPQRASAADREHVVDRLRAGRLSEQLSLETFAQRVELAYAARSRDDLSALVADLPVQTAVERAVVAGVTTLSRWTARIEWAWRHARLPQFVLPAGELTCIGRSRDCDWVLGDPTVSRHHASLRHSDGRWWLVDLGSLNGTWLNGRRLLDEAEVRAGDELAFGDTAFTVAAAARRAG